MWDLSCADWQGRIREGRSLVPTLPLHKPEAKRGVAIWNRLRLPDVEGRPYLAEAGGEWFREIVGTLFGAYDPVAEFRAIREFFLLVSKKNSKTTNGAALMLTALLMNRRPRAEFLLVGPTKMVADLAYNQIVGMIDADDEGFLQKRMRPREHVREIIDLRTKAKLTIKAFDTSVVSGVKPVGILVDELHEIASDPNADRVIGQLRGGMIANPEAFLIFITTQSERPPAGVFRAELQKARDIRDGRLTSVPMLPVLYEFPPEIVAMPKPGETPLWYDSSIWWMVTPNRGRSIAVDRLVPDFLGAKNDGEGELRRWASQHLNIEIGLSLHSDRWVGADHWEARGEPGLTLGALIERCEVAVVGIDGGGLDDLLGLAVLGRRIDGKGWLLWCRAWAHQSVLERRKGEAAKLRDLEKAGDLVIVERLGQDIEDVADIIEQVEAAGLLPEKNAIGVDPIGIGSIVDEIAARGIESERIVAVPQGWKLNGAIKTLERKLVEGALTHAAQELMAWAVGNAKAIAKGNAITIDKQAAGSAKIDPLVAAFCATALMAMNPTVGAGSYLDEEDVLVL